MTIFGENVRTFNLCHTSFLFFFSELSIILHISLYLPACIFASWLCSSFHQEVEFRQSMEACPCVRKNTEFPLSQRLPLCSCALAFGTQVKALSFSKMKFLSIVLERDEARTLEWEHWTPKPR